MTVPFEIHHESIRSYKRLNYTMWHALAEFVDNSTQSYANNQPALDEAYEHEGRGLEVDIVYDKEGPGLLRISDTAMGMSLDELRYAFRVGAPPANKTGRSQYGMGLKTAACWLGNIWSVRTKKLGETSEHRLTVDVEAVADGLTDLPHEEVKGLDRNLHHTVIEVTHLNQKIHVKTNKKIREFLSSMYREDFRAKRLRLTWQGQPLDWLESDDWFYVSKATGKMYKREVALQVDGHPVTGWVGILEKGSRAKAGFAQIHRGRVIKGWPDSWRPEAVFGQTGGTNNLLNQRLVGEIHLDDFFVTHTKDGIVWIEEQQHHVEKALRDEIKDYMKVANTPRKGAKDELGPSDLEVQAAVDQVELELNSPEFGDALEVDVVPPESVVHEGLRPVRETVDPEHPTFSARVGNISVKVYLSLDLAPSEPYLVLDTAQPDEVVVIVNRGHPHLQQVLGSDGMANYLRHCVYDGIAEWQALHKASTIDPDTIKILKDRLLRLPIQLQDRLSSDDLESQETEDEEIA